MNLMNSSTRLGDGAGIQRPRTGRLRSRDNSAPSTRRTAINSSQRSFFMHALEVIFRSVARLMLLAKSRECGFAPTCGATGSPGRVGKKLAKMGTLSGSCFAGVAPNHPQKPPLIDRFLAFLAAFGDRFSSESVSKFRDRNGFHGLRQATGVPGASTRERNLVLGSR